MNKFLLLFAFASWQVPFVLVLAFVCLFVWVVVQLCLKYREILKGGRKWLH